MPTHTNSGNLKSFVVRHLCSDEDFVDRLKKFTKLLEDNNLDVVVVKHKGDITTVETILYISGLEAKIKFVINRAACKLTAFIKFHGFSDSCTAPSRETLLNNFVSLVIDRAILLMKQWNNIKIAIDDAHYCLRNWFIRYDDKTGKITIETTLPITPEKLDELKACLYESFIDSQ